MARKLARPGARGNGGPALCARETSPAQQDGVGFAEDFELPGFINPDFVACGFFAVHANGPFPVRARHGDGEIDFAFSVGEIEVAGGNEARLDRLAEGGDGLLIGLDRRDRIAVGIVVFEKFPCGKKDASEDENSYEDEAETATPDDADDLACLSFPRFFDRAHGFRLPVFFGAGNQIGRNSRHFPFAIRAQCREP